MRQAFNGGFPLQERKSAVEQPLDKNQPCPIPARLRDMGNCSIGPGRAVLKSIPPAYFDAGRAILDAWGMLPDSPAAFPENRGTGLHCGLGRLKPRSGPAPAEFRRNHDLWPNRPGIGGNSAPKRFRIHSAHRAAALRAFTMASMDQVAMDRSLPCSYL